ncbi:MAG: DNA-binding protein [Sphingobium sp.]|nr:MAG: DNA-binding protein [Sphingobium sp.]
MNGPVRPLPAVNGDNRPFWTGGRDGLLMIARCADCGYHVHPPARFCPACESRTVAPQAVSGRGRVYSFTVNYKAWVPDLPVPYVLALVELDEQAVLRLPANIVGCDPDDVEIGMAVSVRFETVEDLHVPLFGPAA